MWEQRPGPASQLFLDDTLAPATAPLDEKTILIRPPNPSASHTLRVFLFPLLHHPLRFLLSFCSAANAMHHPTIVSTLTAVLAALPAAQAAGLYTKNSPVLQVDSRSYDKLITKSNYTSIVEFYAPWCGHCQNLKPAFEKAAKNLDGLAKVAAVNCDEESNKAFCGGLGVTGFPTLKIVRPGKKAGSKPVVEDYQGQRTASGIVDAVVSKINNHVTRVTDKDADAFFAKPGPKAVLFTEKGTTSALLRGVAIDFLDVISVAQVRNKDTAVVEKFGIDKFPSLVLVPAEGEPIVYDGELNKKDIVAFLKQAGEPNPDPAPGKAKPAKPAKADKKTKPTDKGEKTEKVEKKAEEAKPEEPVEEATPESTEQAVPDIIPIKTLVTYDDLVTNCLHPKAQTCVLALVTQWGSEDTAEAIGSLSKLSTKYIQGHRHLFPFFAVPNYVEGIPELRESLEIGTEVQIIALNARRSWWRQYEGDFSLESVEAWLDAMRMGEGAKKKLPKGVAHEIPEPSDLAGEDAPTEPVAESDATQATQATDPEPEVETEAPAEEGKHDEL
ncbi:putative protein disulfide-isomerase [Paramyrothecium foliicola]|nr:putative protein disulfide-isomerase [Paramyrothecium foliicola]